MHVKHAVGIGIAGQRSSFEGRVAAFLAKYPRMRAPLKNGLKDFPPLSEHNSMCCNAKQKRHYFSTCCSVKELYCRWRKAFRGTVIYFIG